MGTRNLVLILSDDERVFNDIRIALNKENTAECDWEKTLSFAFLESRQEQAEVIFLDEALCSTDVAATVQELIAKVPAAKVIFLANLGKRNNIEAALSAGAVGYLLKPIDDFEVAAAVRRVLENPHSTGEARQTMRLCPVENGKIITLFSTVGSVGKTTIAVNLAVLLAQLSGKKVCVVDADLQFGDVCRFLHSEPTVTVADFAVEGVIAGRMISEYMTNWQQKIDILAAPRKVRQLEFVTPTIMDAAITELACSYDYVVVDTAVGFTDVGVNIIDRANLILFVNTLASVACVKNLKRGFDTLKMLGYTQDKVKLILNRYKAKTGIDASDVENAIHGSFLVRIGNDFSATTGSLQAQQPLVLYQPDKEISQDILDLARKIFTDTLEEDTGKLSMADRLSRWLKR